MWDKEYKKRYQLITGGVMHLGQVSHSEILSVVNQLAKVMPKPSKAHMGVAKQLLCYLAGSVNFSTTYNRGGSKLAA